MEVMTLREICEALEVSRRAVQGYEKAGLVSATDQNKYGHLLYDEAAMLRIEQIKLQLVCKAIKKAGKTNEG